MRLTRVEIQNFRSIRHLVLDLSDTTVFIGPNNVGKTAILDAIRLALTRCWGESGTRYRSTDVGDAPDGSGEHNAFGACITLWAEETAPEEWPHSRSGRYSMGSTGTRVRASYMKPSLLASISRAACMVQLAGESWSSLAIRLR